GPRSQAPAWERTTARLHLASTVGAGLPTRSLVVAGLRPCHRAFTRGPAPPAPRESPQTRPPNRPAISAGTAASSDTTDCRCDRGASASRPRKAAESKQAHPKLPPGAQLTCLTLLRDQRSSWSRPYP